jgi:hypothetical protein
MGPLQARRKRAVVGQMRLAAGLIPGSAIALRLINPAGFDKITPPAVQRPLTITAAFGDRFAVVRLLTQFSQSGFTTCLAAPTETAMAINFGDSHARRIHTHSYS